MVQVSLNCSKYISTEQKSVLSVLGSTLEINRLAPIRGRGYSLDKNLFTLTFSFHLATCHGLHDFYQADTDLSCQIVFARVVAVTEKLVKQSGLFLLLIFYDRFTKHS